MEEVKIDGITITKKDIDGKKHYKVSVFLTDETEFKKAIDVIRNEIEKGELTPLDKLEISNGAVWKEKFNEEINKIMKEQYPELTLQKQTEREIRGVEEFTLKDFIKMLDTLALVRKDKDVKVLFKSRVNLEDLENAVKVLENNFIDEVGYGEWKTTLPSIYGDVYG